MIINLTAGMGGDLEIGPGEDPMRFGRGTDLVGGLTRLAHVEELLPEICTLDCGTLNFGDGDYIYVSTPAQLRAGAKRIQELGVKPELEIFDTGHLWFANQLLKEGLLDNPPLFQLCMGIPWGAPPDTGTMKAMVDNMPPGAHWAGFGIGRMQMPMVAQAMLLGGHVRVGLEDNLWLDRGVPATQRRARAARGGNHRATGRPRAHARRRPQETRSPGARRTSAGKAQRRTIRLN